MLDADQIEAFLDAFEDGTKPDPQGMAKPFAKKEGSPRSTTASRQRIDLRTAWNGSRDVAP